MKRSDLYKAIRNVALSKMKYLAYVDLQKGQFRRISENIPLPLPSLLIELKDARYTDVLKGSQMGNLTVSLYLYLDLLTDSFDGSDMEVETIELLDKMDDVFQAFQDVRCELFTKLNRTGEATVEYGKRYMCFRTDFTTSVKDVKVLKTVTISRPSIQLDVNK